MTRIGSLFSGYGGLCHLGVAPVIGGRVVWHCEYEPPTEKAPKPTQAAARILAHHWPDVPNHGDITTVDWTQVEPVDWLVGGFPCTDVSLAGKRAGLAPDTRSGLWAHFAHAISILRPTWVLIENVEGLRSADADSHLEPCACSVRDRSGKPVVPAFGVVLGDLATLGFDAEWVSVRACDAGAPHERERVFILAWPAAPDTDGERGHGGRVHGPGERRGPEPADGGRPVANADGVGLQSERGGSPSNVTLTDAVIRTELGTRPNPRHALLPTPVASDGTKSGPNQRGGVGISGSPQRSTCSRPQQRGTGDRGNRT